MMMFIFGFFAGALVSLFIVALCGAADQANSSIQASPTKQDVGESETTQNDM